MTPEIAIVDSNTLSCLGLQNLLEEIIPTASSALSVPLAN
mgnify:FL=1